MITSRSDRGCQRDRISAQICRLKSDTAFPVGGYSGPLGHMNKYRTAGTWSDGICIVIRHHDNGPYRASSRNMFSQLCGMGQRDLSIIGRTVRRIAPSVMFRDRRHRQNCIGRIDAVPAVHPANETVGPSRRSAVPFGFVNWMPPRPMAQRYVCAPKRAVPFSETIRSIAADMADCRLLKPLPEFDRRVQRRLGKQAVAGCPACQAMRRRTVHGPCVPIREALRGGSIGCDELPARSLPRYRPCASVPVFPVPSLGASPPRQQ